MTTSNNGNGALASFALTAQKNTSTSEHEIIQQGPSENGSKTTTATPFRSRILERISWHRLKFHQRQSMPTEQVQPPESTKISRLFPSAISEDLDPPSCATWQEKGEAPESTSYNDIDTDSDEEEASSPSSQRLVRKAAAAVVGGSLVAVGIPLIPLPGPGDFMVLGGMAILASEFPAARRALDGTRDKLEEALQEEDDSEEDDEASAVFDACHSTVEKDEKEQAPGTARRKIKTYAKGVGKHMVLPLLNQVCKDHADGRITKGASDQNHRRITETIEFTVESVSVQEEPLFEDFPFNRNNMRRYTIP